jgi:hypothetical protein
MAAIVQINFDYSGSQAELEQGSVQAANLFTNIDGLVWKIWLVTETGKRAGGIYLFETREQADAYAASELVAHLKQQRRNTDVRVFDTIEAAGDITSAPRPR